MSQSGTWLTGKGESIFEFRDDACLGELMRLAHCWYFVKGSDFAHAMLNYFIDQNPIVGKVL